jgi:hypothetical protein
MRLPKKLYYLHVQQGEGKPFRTHEKRGGKYTLKSEARLSALAHLRVGRKVHLFETETNWREVERPWDA